MKVRASWIVITGVFSLLLLIGWAGRGQEKTPQKATWEYKLITAGGVSAIDAARTEKMLNDLGGQGWELVSAQPYAQQFVINQGESNTRTVNRYDYYFKRQAAK
jgi:hypothetical protein